MGFTGQRQSASSVQETGNLHWVSPREPFLSLYSEEVSIPFDYCLDRPRKFSGKDTPRKYLPPPFDGLSKGKIAGRNLFPQRCESFFLHSRSLLKMKKRFQEQVLWSF